MVELAGRTAFVTGGANGVGIGLVRALGQRGAKVALADIRPDAIGSALAALRDDGFGEDQVIGVPLDVMDRARYKEVADAVEEQLGPVSLLFNNAGVNLFQTIEDSSYDDWDWVLGVNLHGVINGVQTFVPRMVERAKAGTVQGGHVTNTVSMASFVADGHPGIYNTSKFAVRGLTTSLRHSLWRYGIGVSAVHPGLVKSYIYASDDVRPEGLMGEMQPVDKAHVEWLAGVHAYGMEPAIIAERILEGIAENRANIFTHPDHKEEVESLFAEILADYRDYPKDPGFEERVGFEKIRQAEFVKSREQAAKLYR